MDKKREKKKNLKFLIFFLKISWKNKRMVVVFWSLQKKTSQTEDLMSLYHLLHGKPSDKVFEKLILWCGLQHIEIPRFRDICVSGEEPVVTITTRTGGGNREEHEADNAAMTAFDTFIEDYDCSWDKTYAEFRYDIKKEYIGEWEKMVKGE